VPPCSATNRRIGPREQRQRVGQRGQRIAQLVRQHREELVLAAVGLEQVPRMLGRLRLGALEVGDVEMGADHAQRPALRVALDLAERADPVHLAV
jgi:hypothetical protein